jgi:precorrin-2 dehydrogenase / sirohydrochlorin ferrochelatase
MKKASASVSYYPVFLNLTGKKCVVAGGGQVALRKVQSLLGSGASIEVIGSRICPGLAPLAAKGLLEIRRQKYDEGDIDGAYAVIAATGDRKLNRSIASEARRKKVLVNVVDDPVNCDFIMPSIMRRGDIAIAISTGGKSPALARKLRARLEKEFGEEYEEVARLIGQVRQELKDESRKIKADKWQQAIDLDALAGLVRKGLKEEAKAQLKKNLLG